MLPASVRESLEKQTGSRCTKARVISETGSAGAYRVELVDGRLLFLKWRRDDAEPLVAEMTGLEELSAANSGLIVPRSIAFGWDIEDGAYLATEWLEAALPDSRHWTELGRRLAVLHRAGSQRFGFATDNFIGLSAQRNGWSDRWPIFFVQCRLEPQVSWARERGLWNDTWDACYAKLLGRIDELLPAHPEASLVHGDLWSGNAMAAAAGPAVFDPAVYYGHRETDLAMTRLFGGFAPQFYEAYEAVWPLAPGHQDRFEIYNLYHLINHLNIFGASYAPSVERTLKRFAG